VMAPDGKHVYVTAGGQGPDNDVVEIATATNTMTRGAVLTGGGFILTTPGIDAAGATLTVGTINGSGFTDSAYFVDLATFTASPPIDLPGQSEAALISKT